MAVKESIFKKKLKIRMPYSNTFHANVDRKSHEKIEPHAKVSVLDGKRKAELVLDGEKEKRRGMNPSVKRQCGAILDALITHPSGWVFSCPVDPVALNIPDYFSIISNPMDLGTIKSKLTSSRYFTVEEFASDIRLTFSNAMLYNPPGNPVHDMAKDLECVFIRRWKLLEAKWKHKTSSTEHRMVSSGSEKTAQDAEKTCYMKSQGLISSGIEKKTQASGNASSKKSQGLISGGFDKSACCKKSDYGCGSVVKRPMSLVEKQKLSKVLIEMLKGKVNGKLRSVLQKFGFLDVKKENIDLDIDALPDDILWELKRALKDIPDASSSKDSEYKILSAKMKIQDSDSKILSIHARRLDLDSSSQLDEDSGSGGVNEENTCLGSSLARIVTSNNSGEGWTSLLDDDQALKKALRVATLKSRFAETICKASGGKADVQQEKERLKRLQCEEEAFKARIKEELLKKETELKRQREKQREAARLALKMMERTVELEDNLMIWKDLEMISQCSPTYMCHGCGSVMVLRHLKTGEVLKPLEQLGLHIKEEFMADDEEQETSLSWEGEEGEIL